MKLIDGLEKIFLNEAPDVSRRVSSQVNIVYPVFHSQDFTFKTIFPTFWANREKNPNLVEYEYKRILKGYEIQKKLHDDSISVAKPFGMRKMHCEGIEELWNTYAPDFNLSKGAMQGIPGLLMSRVKGLCGTREEKSEEEIKLVEKEIDKTRKLGYTPSDDYTWNYLFIPSEDKQDFLEDQKRVVLIDFDSWKEPPIDRSH